MRDLVRVAAANKKTALEDYRNSRLASPSGGWASNVRLGTISNSTTQSVLGAPEDRPADVVQRAAQVAGGRISKLPPLASAAETNDWFTQAWVGVRSFWSARHGRQ